MVRKITKHLVDATAPADKDVFVFDDEVAGFALKVTPTGRKVYQLRYRMGGRQTALKTYTLGAHGVLTAEQARKQTVILLGRVKDGIDPALEKKKWETEQRGGRTVNELSEEFLRDHGRHLKPRSLVEYRNAFRLHICPRLSSNWPPLLQTRSHQDRQRR